MANTIAENLSRLVTAKTDIANAITTMGGTVSAGDGFEDFPADIATIPSGGEILYGSIEPYTTSNKPTTIYEGSVAFRIGQIVVIHVRWSYNSNIPSYDNGILASDGIKVASIVGLDLPSTEPSHQAYSSIQIATQSNTYRQWEATYNWAQHTIGISPWRKDYSGTKIWLTNSTPGNYGPPIITYVIVLEDA